MNASRPRILTLGRILITLVALFTSISPFRADFNVTHVYNPAWPPHAKFHNAQTMLMGALLGVLSLVYLWRRSGEALVNLGFATVLASIYWDTQIFAIAFPGTAFVDPEHGGYHPFPKLLGIPINQSVMSFVILVILVAAYFMESGRLKRQGLVAEN